MLISIEPIGDYAFCYSPLCPDMYEHFKRTGGHPWQEDKVWQELGSLRYHLIENAPWVAAAASGCEIMIFAQSFRYRHEAL